LEEFEFVDTTLQSLRKQLDPSQIFPYERQPPEFVTQLQSVFSSDHAAPPLAYPKSTEELRSLLTWATRDQNTLLVCGNASKLGWGTPISGIDFILSTAQLNQVIDYAVDDSTITVQAGIPFHQLQTLLKEHGQMLPIDPSHPGQATLGGILSTRDTGSLRQRYGSVRELCLGLSFVRADGELAKGGGRVVKNVAGYDLMKLFTGAFGSLGIISDLTLRLYPIQEFSHTLLLSGSQGAIATLAATLLDSTLTPVSIDFLSQTLLKRLNVEGEMGLAVRFQSLAESVSAQVKRLKEMGANLATTDYDTEADEPLWRRLQDTLWEKSTEPTIIAKVGMLPQSIPSTLQTFQGWCDQQSVEFQSQVVAGWGIGTLRLMGENAALKALVRPMRTHCEAHQGYLSLLEAPLDIKQSVEVWGYPGNAIAPMKKLKAQFDPHHLLNPGRFVGGL
jgi:glycolate oxidase FAD binding subunit